MTIGDFLKFDFQIFNLFLSIILDWTVVIIFMDQKWISEIIIFKSKFVRIIFKDSSFIFRVQISKDKTCILGAFLQRLNWLDFVRSFFLYISYIFKENFLRPNMYFYWNFFSNTKWWFCKDISKGANLGFWRYSFFFKKNVDF